jgi:inosine/xanthosine triphosphatase
MIKVIVASKNPVKLQAVRLGFEEMFPKQDFDFSSLEVPSGVSDQPASDLETLQGARNRALRATELFPQADYWVGVEGGIEDDGKDMCAFAWIYVHSKQKSGKGRTGTFFLPPEISKLVRSGIELGEADDMVFGTENSKQANGAVGILTENVIDRAMLYKQAVILALIPFKNGKLYP